MSELTIGILGGGQLGSLLCLGARKLNINTVVYCDDKDAPAQIYANDFIFGDYKDKTKIEDFINKVDVVTYEFENIPFETLDLINQFKEVKPKPAINKIVQHRLYEKDFINKCNISTTRYVSIKEKSDLNANIKLIPGLLKTCRLGYDGKGQYKLSNSSDLENLNIDFSQEYILEKMINLKKEFFSELVSLSVFSTLVPLYTVFFIYQKVTVHDFFVSAIFIIPAMMFQLLGFKIRKIRLEIKNSLG